MNHQGSEHSFDDLLERLCIEELSEFEWQELAAKIGGDDAALRNYIEAAQWSQSVGYFLNDGPSPGSAVLGLVDKTVLDGADSHSSLPSAVPADSGKRTAVRPSFYLRRLFGPWAIAASASFLAGAGVTAVVLHRPAERSVQTVAQVPQDKPQFTFAPQAPFIQDSQLGKVSGLSLE